MDWWFHFVLVSQSLWPQLHHISLFQFQLGNHPKNYSLGIPWQPVSKQGHNFQSSFEYVGFKFQIGHKLQIGFYFFRKMAPSSFQSLHSALCSHSFSQQKKCWPQFMALFSKQLSSTSKAMDTSLPCPISYPNSKMTMSFITFLVLSFINCCGGQKTL